MSLEIAMSAIICFFLYVCVGGIVGIGRGARAGVPCSLPFSPTQHPRKRRARLLKKPIAADDVDGADGSDKMVSKSYL